MVIGLERSLWRGIDQNAFIDDLYSMNQRTSGLAWIWRQPPKLQAKGSNPFSFAIFSIYIPGPPSRSL